MEATKHDRGKPRLSLIPPLAEMEFARVLTFGASKYGDNNWRLGIPWSRFLDAMMRHINAIRNGEDYDAESGLLHSAHIMCSAAFLTEYYTIHTEGDDRPADIKSRYKT